MKSVFITSATRTAVGSLNKTLKNVPSHELGSAVINESVKISQIEKEDVDEVSEKEKNLAKDYQLQRALDLIKGVSIFEESLTE